jgi:hypothetical protein
LNLANNGVVSGTPSASATTYYFDIVVTDAVANAVTNTLSLTIVNPPLPPLAITNVSFPNGTVSGAYSAQLGATGGQPPYYWSLALGSANPPPGLTLDPSGSGLISGTPTTKGLFNFKVQLTDNNSSTTNKVFGIIINPQPALTFSAWLTNRFFLQISGASNQNYTVLVSTNLAFANWVPILVTNNHNTNTYIVADPNATNQQRYYRVKVGP